MNGQEYTIKGWLARDYIGDYLCFFNNKPVNKDRGRWRDENANTGTIIAKFGEDSFPKLTWESEPIEVEFTFKKT